MDDERFYEIVQRVLSGADRGTAEKATQAVLETLAERISKPEALQLAAELPPSVAPWVWTDGPAQRLDLEAFLRKVAEREGADLATAERHVRAVLWAVARAVSPKQWADVTGLLSQDYLPLLPVGPDVEVLPESTFVGRVAERAGVDEAGARRAVEAVLETLAERLAAGEIDDLADRLPLTLRRLLKQAETRTPPTARRMDLDAFLARIAEREGVPVEQARRHARAVLLTLHEAVGDDEFFDVTSELPPDYDQLWLPA
jgi:uncharacterized protein (DUF2267 family)